MAKKKTAKRAKKQLGFWKRVAQGWKKFFSSAWCK
tara:strand:+ start:105 stop:209 length:105 start_codon:yes stop_codon:yes gene_type:complete